MFANAMRLARVSKTQLQNAIVYLNEVASPVFDAAHCSREPALLLHVR